MKRLLLAVIGMAIASVSVYFYGCGNINPAYAPYGSGIQLVGFTQAITDTWQCDATWGVPSPCMSAFTAYCVTRCEYDVESGKGPDQSTLATYQECLHSSTKEQCAVLTCGSDVSQNNGWINECALPLSGEAARSFISNRGVCTSIYYLIPALVTLNEFTVSQSSSSTSSSTGGSPQNDIQVRWVAMGGELYKPSDVVGSVPPLSDPFYDKTDSRGISEIKYLVSTPRLCGDQIAYSVSADIGVAAAAITITETVSGGTTVDDDTSSDDDTSDDDNDDNDDNDTAAS